MRQKSSRFEGIAGQNYIAGGLNSMQECSKELFCKGFEDRGGDAQKKYFCWEGSRGRGGDLGIILGGIRGSRAEVHKIRL